jgi:DNA-binding NarL/FixJ family response regulator
MPGAVLLVDDDAAFRSVARFALRDAGLAVAGEADSARAALVAALCLKPEAVLVDIALPDGDGVALARELAALPWRPRVVLTSSDRYAASDDEVRASGAHGFVIKEDLPDAARGPLFRPLARPPDLG